MEELEIKVVDWAHEKGIFDKSVQWAQLRKTYEEVKEFEVELDNSWNEIKQEYVPTKEMACELGDILVTLIIQAHMNGFHLSYCLEMAYEKIKDRKGEMKNGYFVKEGE